VSLGTHGSQIYGNPQIILRVEFPSGAPADYLSLYWRGRSYDHFDGLRWRRSPRVPPSLAPSGWYDAWGPERLEQRIYGARLDTRILFALHPIFDIDALSDIQPIFDNVGDLSYWGSAAPSYTAQSIRGRPTPEQLRTAAGGFVPAQSFFLQLPTLSSRVRSLSDSLLGRLPTSYDKAIALVGWFQEEFAYTLDLPGSPEEATLDHFLLERRAGHCEYFSTAMAILLRSQGVPAREVNGFLGGEWSDFGDYLAVTQNQAHAWVEVWFPGYGWVPFDPTPAGGGSGFAETAWFWPGRFLFDALQHRWNKWVLDYSFQTQSGLLQKTRGILSRGDSPQGLRPFGEEGSHPGGLLLWAAAIVVLGAAGIGASRRRKSYSPSTRLYLQLRDAARGAGLPLEALRSPGSLTNHLSSTAHPGAAPARRIVEGYLRDRYSGNPLTDPELRELRHALRDARTRLRRHRFR